MALRSRFKPHQFTSPNDPLNKDVTINDKLDSAQKNISSSHNTLMTKLSNNQFDLTKLKEEQQHDPTIRNILKRIHIHPNKHSFVLKDNLLYKLTTPSRHSKRRMEVIYVPSSMVKSLLHAYHDDPMTGAHFSFDRTYNEINIIIGGLT